MPSYPIPLLLKNSEGSPRFFGNLQNPGRIILRLFLLPHEEYNEENDPPSRSYGAAGEWSNDELSRMSPAPRFLVQHSDSSLIQVPGFVV